jgi:hypothetical protein
MQDRAGEFFCVVKQAIRPARVVSRVQPPALSKTTILGRRVVVGGRKHITRCRYRDQKLAGVLPCSAQRALKDHPLRMMEYEKSAN